MNINVFSSIAIIPQNLDIIALAERCELLTDVLTESESPDECAVLCRYVCAHLEAVKEKLDNPLSDERIVQLSVNSAAELPTAEAFADSDDLCDYGQAVTQALLKGNLPRDITDLLAGLLMRLTTALVDDLTAPRFLLERHG